MCFRGSSKSTDPNPLVATRPTLSRLICAVSLEILNHHNPNFTSYHFSSLPPAAANHLFIIVGKWMNTKMDTKMALAREIWHMTL